MKNKEKIVIISVEGEDLAAFYHDVNGDGILNIGRTWFDQSPHHSDPKIDLVLEKQYEVWGVSISAESGDAYLCHGEHEDHILINVNNCMRAFPKKK